MRLALVAAVFLAAGCGSSSKKDDSSAPAATPEVAKLNIDQSCITAALGCTLTIDAIFTTSGNTYLGPGYSLAVQLAEGDPPPACDANSKSGAVIQFQSLKVSTAYGFRGCVFDGKTYSKGFPQSFTTATPAS